MIRRHVLTWGAGVIALALLLTGRVTPRAAARAIDLDLLLLLFALLVTVEVLRASGYIDLIVHEAVDRFRTTRGFALALIALSGALASLVTNDVTLFVVIPFTIIASRITDFDVEDAVLLEIARLTTAWPAAIAALIAGVGFLRRRLLQIDLSIVPLFFFAFIIVDGLRSFRLDVSGGSLYITSIAISQIISNVPATVLL